MGLELNALSTEGDVGELLVAPEAGEIGVMRHATVKRELSGLRGGRGAGGGAGALRRHRAGSPLFDEGRGEPRATGESKMHSRNISFFAH